MALRDELDKYPGLGRFLIADSTPMIIYDTLAILYGLDEAIFIQKLAYYVTDSQSGRVVNGRRWIWNTYDEWCEMYPWWTKRTMQRMILGLEDLGIIVTKQFDKKQYMNRKKYYTVDFERFTQETESRYAEWKKTGKRPPTASQKAKKKDQKSPQTQSNAIVPKWHVR